MRIGLEVALASAGASLARALEDEETIDAEEFLVALVEHANYTLRGCGLKIERQSIEGTLVVRRVLL